MRISSGFTVSPGQTETGDDVLSGGQLFVTVSATAEGTTIERGGVVQVLGGLTADDTIFGGEENVQFGTAHVSSGGTTMAIWRRHGRRADDHLTRAGRAQFRGFALDAAIVNSGALDVHAGAGAFDTQSAAVR